MAQRLELQTLLKSLIGSNNVYFQPPSNLEMEYPCIIYKRDDIFISHADNSPYRNKTRYKITVVDQNPDSTIHEEVGKLPTVSYDRSYVADNLNHDVYNLYF